jgi:hypothetical protein
VRGRPPRPSEDPVGPTVFVPGRLEGVRQWSLASDQSGAIRLTGLNGVAWSRDGKTTAARCECRDVQHRGPAPAGACCCGLYALHPWAADSDGFRLQNLFSGLSVVGVVEAWGTVQVHGEGFRAQYARPTAFALLGLSRASEYGDLLARLAAAHRAEVIGLGGVGELMGHCVDVQLGLSRRTVAQLLEGGDPRPR